jgi:hypothetical protein
MCREGFNKSVTGQIRRSLLRLASYMLLTAMGASSSGCITAVGIGFNLVGKAVDVADVKKREKELLGARLSTADEMFGKRLDTLRDLNSDRSWVIYPVEIDILGDDRYVVEVAAERIVALSRTEKNSDPKRDLLRVLIIRSKIKGMPRTECAAELDMGSPLLTVRSDATGLLSQIYDARHFKELGSPDYCILRFDEQELCMDVEFLGIGASTRKEPLHTQPARGRTPVSLRPADLNILHFMCARA